ncbi:putative efflux protein, MATE family [Marinilactibacillus piezotolerans]|uniref:Multidrug export protein MepA n=1 Tax=Marinilactibacillus piezotolerans TaxID=258723 RepID=A0A1I3ZUW0_9LACT|nr:MATE family efflux transporter [Marinilactibacillus piezotolerans]SFK47690.1 putative efflux protein, MATE family [Marinilactibacillus piezotolerans]
MKLSNTEERLRTVNVGKLLLTLSIPNIVAQLINMLYNVVDRMFIGHIPEVGSLALTGVGVAFPIVMLIMAFSYFIGMGGAPLASIKMGQGNKKDGERILGTSVVMLVMISVTLTVLFLVFGEQLLVLFGASAETLPFAWDYMKLYTLGTIFVQLALGLTPFISAQGFAKESMLAVLIGAVFNIVLDPILIYGFDMGVQGAAIATVISQMMSAIYVLHFLLGKKTTLKIRKEHLKVNKGFAIGILSLGISPFIMQSTESLLNISFNTALSTYGGDINVGAMTIIASLMQALILPLMGLTQGAQPIISYNYGAQNNERVKKAFTWLFGLSVGYSTLFWLVMKLTPRFLIRFFTTDPALMETTIASINVYMAVVFVLGAQIATQQTLIALGQTRQSLILALLRKIILLIPLIYILPQFMSNKVFAVLVAEPIADFLSVTITVIVFFITFKKLLANNHAEIPDHPEAAVESSAQVSSGADAVTENR